MNRTWIANEPAEETAASLILYVSDREKLEQIGACPEALATAPAATLHQPRHAYAGRAELGTLAYELRTTCACFCFVQP
jgi:hypothetical protein